MLHFFSKSSIVDYIEKRNFLDSIVENRNYKYSHTYLNSCLYVCVLRVWDCRRLWLITKENLSIELRRQRIFKKSVLCPKHTIYFLNSIRILFWTQFIKNTSISMNVRHYLVFYLSIASKPFFKLHEHKFMDLLSRYHNFNQLRLFLFAHYFSFVKKP